MAGCGTVADYKRQWQADGGGAVAVCGGAASYIFMRQLAEERNDKKSAKSSRRAEVASLHRQTLPDTLRHIHLYRYIYPYISLHIYLYIYLCRAK